MPQLDLATYPSQIFWLAIFFTALYLFVRGYIAPAIESLITLRDNKIEEDLNAASKARGKAVELREGYEAKRKNVYSKVSDMLEGELSNLNKLTQEQTQKVNTDIHSLTQNVEIEISTQKNKYKEELEQVVLEYSAYLIKKVSGLETIRDDLKKYRN